MTESNKNPLISVIVPFYNDLTTIERCIKSILSQSFNDLELILVDDGSNDGSANVAHKYRKADKRTRVIKQKNEGVSAARNTGIEHSRGEHIVFCDADDYWGKDWLNNLSKESIKYDIVFANYINVDENGNRIKESSYPKSSIQLNSRNQRLDFIIENVFQKKCSWTVWSCLFKKSIIIDNDIRFNLECDNFGEDLGFVLEYVLCSENISISEENSYYYVSHSGSISYKNNTVVCMNPMNEVSKKFYFRCIKMGYKNYKSKLAIIHFLIMYGQYYKMIGKPIYSELNKEIAKINDKKYYYTMVRKLMLSYKAICVYTDKRTAKQILLFTNYCLHGNWKLFKIESAFFYKLIK